MIRVALPHFANWFQKEPSSHAWNQTKGLFNYYTEDVPWLFRLSSDASWNQTEDDWRLLLALAPEGLPRQSRRTAGSVCLPRTLVVSAMTPVPGSGSGGMSVGEAGNIGDTRPGPGTAYKVSTRGSRWRWCDHQNWIAARLNRGGRSVRSSVFMPEQKIERWSRPRRRCCTTSVRCSYWQSRVAQIGYARLRRRPLYVLDRLTGENRPAFTVRALLFRPGRTVLTLACLGERLSAVRDLIEQCAT